MKAMHSPINRKTITAGSLARQQLIASVIGYCALNYRASRQDLRNLADDLDKALPSIGELKRVQHLDRSDLENWGLDASKYQVGLLTMTARALKTFRNTDVQILQDLLASQK